MDKKKESQHFRIPSLNLCDGWNVLNKLHPTWSKPHSPLGGTTDFPKEEQNVDHAVIMKAALSLWVSAEHLPEGETCCCLCEVKWLAGKRCNWVGKGEKNAKLGAQCGASDCPTESVSSLSEWKNYNTWDLGTINNVLVLYQLCYLLLWEVQCVCVCLSLCKCGSVVRWVKERKRSWCLKESCNDMWINNKICSVANWH